MNTWQTSIKIPIYYCSIAEAHMLGPTRQNEITVVVLRELTKVCKSNSRTLISQTRSVDRLLKLSCILSVRIS